MIRILSLPKKNKSSIAKHDKSLYLVRNNYCLRYKPEFYLKKWQNVMKSLQRKAGSAWIVRFYNKIRETLTQQLPLFENSRAGEIGKFENL